MFNWVIAAGVLAWGHSALASRAGDELARLVRDRAANVGVSTEALGPTLNAIHAADDKGLPADLVADKVLEGLAKGVPPARLAEAASDLGARLEGAQAIIGAAASGLSEEEWRFAISKVAAELAVVRDSKPFLELAEEAHAADLSVFLVATRSLAELVSRGVPASGASSALVLLLRGGYAPAEIGGLTNLFDSYRKEGGRDASPFIEEVKRRAMIRGSLHDLVNPFGDRATPINRSSGPELNGLDTPPGEKAIHGQTALEQMSNGRAGEAPSVGTPAQLRQQSKP
jgi:hypothetical protein